jgi:hypothetical protein
MTAKDKAKELVNQMYDVFNMKNYNDLLIDETDNEINDQLWDKNNELFLSIYKLFAKQCALIAVDEILDVINGIYDYDFEKLNPYWQEVKQEIENL